NAARGSGFDLYQYALNSFLNCTVKDKNLPLNIVPARRSIPIKVKSTSTCRIRGSNVCRFPQIIRFLRDKCDCGRLMFTPEQDREKNQECSHLNGTRAIMLTPNNR